MKIFLDTANVDSIQKYSEMGVIDGITTNPTLLSKETGNPIKTMKKIVEIVRGPVSLEIVATTFDRMMEESLKLAEYGENVVVKVPMTVDGLKVVKALTNKGIKTNVTLIFSANQALLAAKAGATYVSPFIGRLDDIGSEGLNLVSEIIQIFVGYEYTTQVLVASVRHPLHVIESAKMGADVVTLPPEILDKMIKHPLSDKGLDLFLSDWKKIEKDNPNLSF
ncbi:MAG: fructose-6-phosphate aldolase [Candidatus Nitrosocosmicus sp.]|jgi:transaldolase|uniref:fructose-6-phosphate aldolase n=1 Tax=Candidatus Nitrosocosmicus agrestis TaxID=2563600 RepID=UPI00122DFA0A|nr:fructose-6-phosphate aldolase [Candidatus Nitrosocosmicus sp. SS]KAA2282140.1 fructose-6-phosphate aldolase [Candidatus Nitrosocosmicus sp. SS]KAF0870013.1 fructose-6-phosphate aldolase [Candidatus Nitrosocosmicus sp. SS]MDR4492757.1 fructose-6-phosphate aldolase [Candidatus Nitrosocosmicus sp.]HET6591138.1 fructose-6-phosphate aldolase [Candidatus Nitrosocosmicus sp.]